MINDRDDMREAPVRVVDEEVVVLGGSRAPVETRRDFASSLGEAVRDQPVSAALITMGVAWLFLGGAKVSLFGKAAGGRAAAGYPSPEVSVDEDALRHAATTATEGGRQAGSAIRQGASAAGSAVGEGASTAGSALGHGAAAAASGMSDAASRTYGGLESAAHGASQAVSSAGTAAYDASLKASAAARSEAEHLQQSLSEFFERQPWALGALGLAVGAGVAAALPRTRTEREWIGETSDAVKDQAQTVLAEQLEQARRLAARAFEETTREARAQGLSEDKVVEAIRALGEKLTTVAATAGESVSGEVDKSSGGAGVRRDSSAP